MVEELAEVAGQARGPGIALALKACNRYETCLYNTLADTRQTIFDIGARTSACTPTPTA